MARLVWRFAGGSFAFGLLGPILVLAKLGRHRAWRCIQNDPVSSLFMPLIFPIAVGTCATVFHYDVFPAVTLTGRVASYVMLSLPVLMEADRIHNDAIRRLREVSQSEFLIQPWALSYYMAITGPEFASTCKLLRRGSRIAWFDLAQNLFAVLAGVFMV
jgi:hypothetical protein